MTPRTKRIGVRTLLSVAVLIVVCLIGALLVVRTQWFSDYLRTKVIAELEDTTGGKVDIQSFRFEPSRLTVLISGLVIHGTEPRDVSPLAAIDSIALRVKIFPSFGKAVEIPYLSVERPRVNLIVNADGTTNIPRPKMKRQPSTTSPLATVVDLAIGQFRIDQGEISYLQKVTPFSLGGENLHVVLNYDKSRDVYAGRIQIAPLDVRSAPNQTMAMRVDLPLTLERDAVRVMNGHITSDSSDVGLEASLENLNAPRISAKVQARVSVSELKRVLNLPIVSTVKFITANVDGRYDQSSGAIGLSGLQVRLGRSSLHAAGTANPANGGTIRFDGDLSLAELSGLFNLGSARIGGELLLNGNAGIDARHNYAFDGNITSQDLSVAAGDVHLSNVSITTPFRLTPERIGLDRLEMAVFGGTLSAKAALSQMQALTVEGKLHDFSVRAMAAGLSGRTLGYAGAIGGSIGINDDLKASGNAGLVANANLSIAPRGSGIPLNGQIHAKYNGKDGSVNLGNSFVSMPASRATFSGDLNRQLDVHVTSRNLNDFSPLTTVPITLKGGSADLTAQINGSLTTPKIEAQAVVTKFVAKDSLFDKLSLDLSASETGATVRNGLLTQQDLHSSFAGSIGLGKWHPVSLSPVSANVNLQRAGLGDLLAIAGEGKIPAAGDVSADVHINGTYGDPLGLASIEIPNGTVYGQPFTGATAGMNLSHGLVSLDRLQVATAGGTLNANGLFRHPLDTMTSGHVELHVRSNGVQLANVTPLKEKSPGTAGSITLTADAAADLVPSTLRIADVETNLSATNLRVHNQDAGDLTAVAHTSSRIVTYNVKSNFSGSNIDVEGRTSLANGYATEAKATIRSLPVRNALDIAGWSDVPVTGTLSADASLSGTLAAPNISGDVDLSKGNLYEELVDHLSVKISHNNALTGNFRSHSRSAGLAYFRQRALRSSARFEQWVRASAHQRWRSTGWKVAVCTG